MHFITDPYLPNGQVKMIIAGDGLREYENAMQSLGISVLYTKKADCISGALATHADLVVFPYGNGRFLLDPGQEQLANTLREKGAECTFGSAPKDGYPLDVPYNAVKIGKTLICNPKTLDSSIFHLAKSEDCAIISCKQGYTKCSVAVVSENAVITDDPGIKKALTPFFDVLLVKKGSICLDGYPYGLFGGCCGLISKETLLFIGDYTKHDDAERIRAFLRNYGVYPESLCGGPLKDIGSLIPLMIE